MNGILVLFSCWKQLSRYFYVHCMSKRHFQSVECLRSILVRESETGPDIVQNAEGNDDGLYDTYFANLLKSIVYLLICTHFKSVYPLR